MTSIEAEPPFSPLSADELFDLDDEAIRQAGIRVATVAASDREFSEADIAHLLECGDRANTYHDAALNAALNAFNPRRTP